MCWLNDRAAAFESQRKVKVLEETFASVIAGKWTFDMQRRYLSFVFSVAHLSWRCKKIMSRDDSQDEAWYRFLGVENYFHLRSRIQNISQWTWDFFSLLTKILTNIKLILCNETTIPSRFKLMNIVVFRLGWHGGSEGFRISLHHLMVVSHTQALMFTVFPEVERSRNTADMFMIQSSP